MFDFAGKRGWFFLLSFLVVVPGIISLAISPRLKPGIDFSSGSTFTVAFQEQPKAEDLRRELADLGFADSRVQSTGSGRFVIRTSELEEAAPAEAAFVGPQQPQEDQPQEQPAFEQSARGKLEEQLRARFGPMVNAAGDAVDAETGGPAGFQDFSSVSESVSREIGRNAAIAVGAATVAILLYISWAFRHVSKPLRYGIAAVIALAHDALLVLGAFSIFGKLFGVEINAMFITGILTVIGFSVHDTIVVFDRIRENLSTHPGIDLKLAVNASLTETLSRSINTSLTVVITVVTLLALGGVGIRSFLLVLLIGIVAGTYSSIGVASQILVAWEEGDFGRVWRRITFRGARPVEEAP